MLYRNKILAFIGLFSFFLLSGKCNAQYFDSSVLINAALGMYYELPSNTFFTNKNDSIAKQKKYKKVIQRCYLNDTLKTNKITNYNRDGTIRKVVTKFNKDADSLVLMMKMDSQKKFEFLFSFPFEAIKDTMNFGFEEVIDSIGLNEKRYNLNISMQLLDSLTAKNFIVSVNGKYIVSRKWINLYPFFNINEIFVPTKISLDTTFENGFLVKTNIDSLSGDRSRKSKNYYLPNLNRLIKFESFSKQQGGEWMFNTGMEFEYDTLGRRVKIIETSPFGYNSFKIDSFSYYSNGKIRSRKIYTPNNNVIISDSIFSSEGKLLYKHFYGQDYSISADEVGNAYSDTFYTYSKSGNLLQLKSYYNGILTYSEEYEYEYWDE